MIKSTWHEEPGKRPSFTDIVQFLQEQNIEATPVDETGRTIDAEYLNLST